MLKSIQNIFRHRNQEASDSSEIYQRELAYASLLVEVIKSDDKFDDRERAKLFDVLSEKLQFGPKLGVIFKPLEASTFRFTYGKAYNTPTSISLHTDLFIRRLSILDIYLRGNKDGTQYVRVDENTNISQPIYYDAQGNAIVYGKYNFDVEKGFALIQKRKKLVNRGTGAGGSNTNKNGLPYEELTDLDDRITVIENNKNTSKL